MQNSRFFDVPSLTGETEKKLLRVFCFLRQLEKKSRLKKKQAEFHAAVIKHHTQCYSHSIMVQQDPAAKAATAKTTTPPSPSSPSASSRPADDSSTAPLANSTAVAMNTATATTPTPTPPSSPGSSAGNNGYTQKTRSSPGYPSVPVGNQNPGTTDSPDLKTIQSVLGDGENFLKVCGPELKALHKEVEELKKSIVVKETDTSGLITVADMTIAMKMMNRSISKAEAHWMIWEVDNDLDGAVDWDDFRGAYSRAIHDKHNLEPNQLYHVIQFLLCDQETSFAVSVLEITDELRRHVGTQEMASNLLDFYAVELRERDRKLSLAEYLDLVLEDLPSAMSWKCDNF